MTEVDVPLGRARLLSPRDGGRRNLRCPLDVDTSRNLIPVRVGSASLAGWSCKRPPRHGVTGLVRSPVKPKPRKPLVSVRCAMSSLPTLRPSGLFVAAVMMARKIKANAAGSPRAAAMTTWREVMRPA